MIKKFKINEKGVSRGPCILMAYLIQELRVSVDESFKILK